MASKPSSEHGTALIVVGSVLFAFGAMWTLFGARSADLEVCLPPSTACETSLAVQQFFESLYGPNGLCMVLGLVLVVIGIVLRRRVSARHRVA